MPSTAETNSNATLWRDAVWLNCARRSADCSRDTTQAGRPAAGTLMEDLGSICLRSSTEAQRQRRCVNRRKHLYKGQHCMSHNSGTTRRTHCIRHKSCRRCAAIMQLCTQNDARQNEPISTWNFHSWLPDGFQEAAKAGAVLQLDLRPPLQSFSLSAWSIRWSARILGQRCAAWLMACSEERRALRNVKVHSRQPDSDRALQCKTDTDECHQTSICCAPLSKPA